MLADGWPARNIIVFIETITDRYSDAQPQSRSAQGLRRSRDTRQLHGGGQAVEPDAARSDASGARAGAAVRRRSGGKNRQARASHAGRREADRARAASVG